MEMDTRAKVALAIFACLTVAAYAAQKQQFRYSVGPGASVIVVNDYGPVTLKPSSGNQVLVTATPASDKVEIDKSQTGNRIEIRTHFLQRAGQSDGRVDYDIQVPADCNVTIRTATGPVHIEKLHGDITVDGDSSPIDVRDVTAGVLHARTVGGPITLTNVSNGHVELTSVAGDITLRDVSGPKVAVNTTKSTITYAGNFGGGGEYSLTNHSGDINVTMPADASVDLTERSITGTVQNDYPFQPKAHTAFPLTQGRSYAGTSNSGASVVRLRSFSGTIRVKKQ